MRERIRPVNLQESGLSKRHLELSINKRPNRQNTFKPKNIKSKRETAQKQAPQFYTNKAIPGKESKNLNVNDVVVAVVV